MKRNPVIPYALIAVLGITLMIILSFVGLNQVDKVQEEHKNGGEQQQEEGGGESEGGESSSANPEQIFKNNCASCHGSDLSGGVGPNLQKVGSKLSVEDIKGIITNGKGSMPPNLIQGEKKTAVANWLAEKK
ncbi:c-type cytochrome [Pontibacillus yanchengensis]|uniref:C-type cytochrome n=2 Tax=Pontibacillus yanchengensis TaxID=462910 RepID=A0A6I4ZZW5_9BACI|nr:cytochrome c [Pontibacillus yanchengensis]MYL33443.1 c-type cytochrome [Pontibacillus yanchengensis]MYL53493.1 c-type cytochrome [Pontibacillus yanchengensis]